MYKLTIAVTTLSLAIAGCANMNPTQQGTATGAGIGAGLGGIIGAATGGGGAGRAVGGAAIGGALGAVLGNVWSTRMEDQKRSMEQATRGTGVQVTQTADNRLKLEVPSDISFDVGRADIRPDFRAVLDKFALTLNDNPASTVTIIGHTDNTGSDGANTGGDHFRCLTAGPGTGFLSIGHILNQQNDTDDRYQKTCQYGGN